LNLAPYNLINFRTLRDMQLERRAPCTQEWRISYESWITTCFHEISVN